MCVDIRVDHLLDALYFGPLPNASTPLPNAWAEALPIPQHGAGKGGWKWSLKATVKACKSSVCVPYWWVCCCGNFGGKALRLDKRVVCFIESRLGSMLGHQGQQTLNLGSWLSWSLSHPWIAKAAAWSHWNHWEVCNSKSSNNGTWASFEYACLSYPHVHFYSCFYSYTSLFTCLYIH